MLTHIIDTRKYIRIENVPIACSYFYFQYPIQQKNYRIIIKLYSKLIQKFENQLKYNISNKIL